MAPGDVRAAFARAAAEDGIALGPRTFDWLCEQGHVGLERVAQARRDPALVAPVTAALDVLATIFGRLKGDVTVLRAGRENVYLPIELYHEPTGTLVELDAPEHLTAARLTALDLYPADARVGFDVEAWRALCREWSARPGPRLGGMPARAFGFGGVPRERAYHDALVDLGAPAMGHPPVIRIAVTDGDGAAAYARARDELRARLA